MFQQKSKDKGKRGEAIPEPYEGLPDSSHLGGLCPRCGKQSSFKILGVFPASFDGTIFAANRDGTREHVILDQAVSLLCSYCNQPTIVVEEEWVGDHPAREKEKGGGTISYLGIHWWPLPNTQLPKDIPAEIAEAFAEASKALHADCPRASAVMSRRTLEAITVEKGETSGSLAERLRKLETKGVLHPTLVEWVREVRLVGNSGGHYDVINQVSVEDAGDLLRFVRELLRNLYELPADLNRRRKSKS
ncbi:MAG: DUF4145 domain-containing protein [Ktedonobacteraceae bacterium]